jgi:hypothetical protein
MKKITPLVSAFALATYGAGAMAQPGVLEKVIVTAQKRAQSIPQVIFNYLVGLEDELVLTQIPQMKAWLRKITAYLPDNPVLVPDFMIINPIVDLFEELGQKSYA